MSKLTWQPIRTTTRFLGSDITRQHYLPVPSDISLTWLSKRRRQLNFRLLINGLSIQIWELHNDTVFEFYSCNITRSRRSHLQLRSAHTRGLVLATSPLKSLHEGTGRRDLSHKQFKYEAFRVTSHRDLSQKFKLVFKRVHGTSQLQGPKLVTATRFWSKND